jgi:hypothetical protein
VLEQYQPDDDQGRNNLYYNNQILQRVHFYSIPGLTAITSINSYCQQQ